MYEATEQRFTQVRKRNGRLVPFAQTRITSAVSRALRASGEGNPEEDAPRISDQVVAELERRCTAAHVPEVEEIQDLVEEVLILAEFARTAKAYILYRHERARLRGQASIVPEQVRARVAESRQYFRNVLAEFIYYRTYARWIDAEHRRETWMETVERYLGFMRAQLGERLSAQEYETVRQAILQHRVMPSMRLMWSAGRAAETNHCAAYNCSFIAPSRLEDLAEIMYLLMSGVGVGFSAETHNVQQLPIIQRQSGEALPTYVVGDSKEGWADALKHGLNAWYAGKDVTFDYTRIRPAGARLRTMGGRSSGPKPLRALLDFARAKILARQDRRLRNIDVHDIICKVGEVVERGGVRRAALISLSDLDDQELREAKSGYFYINQPQRAMANNSAVYDRKPTATVFLREWLALAEGGTGERGVFNRSGVATQIPQRRRATFLPYLLTCGTNPCGEIILRSKQFCNLTEIIARPQDTEASLEQKVEIAALLGTYQSTLTDFPYLSPEWKCNCEEERLLGVSITGHWECPVLRAPGVLARLRDHAVRNNHSYAQRLGVNPSAAVTCVKPSGTVSQLVDSASGMHPRYAKYYLRRIRIFASDPLFALLKDQKVPYAPEVGQDPATASTFVLEFPVKAPESSITRSDLGALDQLEYWKRVKESYTEHNPSVTISVADDEWIASANWLYNHWEMLGGLSFLARDQTVYELAPYQEISHAEYEQRMAAFPEVDFSRMVLYEQQDTTVGARETACTAGICELDPEEGSPGDGNAPWRYRQ